MLTKKKSNTKINFGMFLRAARTSMDISQTDFAKKLNVTRSFICDIEKGRQPISLNLAVKIANVAGLSEKVAITLCLQEMLERAKIFYKVELKAL